MISVWIQKPRSQLLYYNDFRGEKCQRVRNLESKGKGGEVRQLEEKRGEAMEDSVGQRKLGFMWILMGLTGLDEIYVFRRYLYLVG